MRESTQHKLGILFWIPLVLSLSALAMGIYVLSNQTIPRQNAETTGAPSFQVSKEDVSIVLHEVVVEVWNNGTGDAENVMVLITLNFGLEQRAYQDWIPLIKESQSKSVIFPFGAVDMTEWHPSHGHYIIKVIVDAEETSSYTFPFTIHYPYTD
jgi:hypothetical protein